MLVWNGKFEQPVVKQYRISLVQTVMQRLDDLRQTLPVNLKLNEAYPYLEFVIVDYNSKDGLGEWVKANMMSYIEQGRVVYVRTEEPRYYSMTHSRNIGFKVAGGEIVLNVDADNFTHNLAFGGDIVSNLDPTTLTHDLQSVASKVCFAEYVNLLANQRPRKALFAKGRQLLRGRVGFYKDEFIELLGGYDEQLTGYGHDDRDLWRRAAVQGFMLMWFGGQYCSRLNTSGKKKNENMQEHWRVTERRNKEASDRNMAAGRFRANEGRPWGKAHIVKNFTEELDL
jgi:glycosyltransferase involved in cell wall biosynthesis